MMVDYLKNQPDCIAAVAQFIYEEFVDKTNPEVTLEFCHDFFSKTGIDHLPVTPGRTGGGERLEAEPILSSHEAALILAFDLPDQVLSLKELARRAAGEEFPEEMCLAQCRVAR